MVSPSSLRVRHDQGATFVELFFDLVFVYAVTQLTATVLHDLTWSGVGKAALLFWLVWWSWTQFTWTLNWADTEHTWVRLPVLGATAVAFFLAQAVPDAFTTAGAWFAVSYVAVRVIGLGLQEWILRGEFPDATGLTVWTRASSVGLVLVLVGGFVDGDARIWLWLAALVADLVAGALAGRGSWPLAHSHFTERHGLIVIIALGESLIAAGVATTGMRRDAAFAVTTAGAVVAACALWWTYFSLLHGRLERALSQQTDATRGRFARDVFSLAHAAVVAGVIGVAVGFEAAVAHPGDPLSPEAALALTIGVLLFVGGTAVAAARAGVGSLVVTRLVLVAVVLAATPLVPEVDAAVTLWVLAALVVALILVEARPRPDVEAASA